MYTLACTGGIGSGKSYVCKVFSAMGIPVYYADERAKMLYHSESDLLCELTSLLGDKIVSEGVLQKALFAKIIFSNPRLLNKVNEIVHPYVLKDFLAWKSECQQRGNSLIIIESAIILDAQIFRNCIDGILVVDAPIDVRIARVIKRDSVDERQVIERINRQMGSADMLSKADYIIFADGKRAVLPQICDVLKQLVTTLNC